MRNLMFVLAFTAACGASPALAQTHVLTAQDEVNPSGQMPPPLRVQQKLPSLQVQQEPPPKTQARVRREPPPPPAPPSRNRFSFERVDEGFLRLDHATGKVAYCSAHPSGWSCQAVPEQRATLEQEIARLQEEVAALKKKIADLREPPPPPRPPAPVPPPAAAPGRNGGLELPSEQDIARARAYIAQTWQRLVDMINDIQRSMLDRHDHEGGLSRT